MNARNKNLKGHWNTPQHDRFLKGVKQFGKNWRKVQEIVKTRNISQVRSHAQKYYQKIAQTKQYDRYSGSDQSISIQYAENSSMDISVQNYNHRYQQYNRCNYQIVQKVQQQLVMPKNQFEQKQRLGNHQNLSSVNGNTNISTNKNSSLAEVILNLCKQQQQGAQFQQTGVHDIRKNIINNTQKHNNIQKTRNLIKQNIASQQNMMMDVENKKSVTKLPSKQELQKYIQQNNGNVGHFMQMLVSDYQYYAADDYTIFTPSTANNTK